MFDLSFGKLILVLIIGLVVLGPARLPEAIKTVAGWIKALRRISASVQLELNKELKLQELQDSLKKAEKSGLTNITPEIQASIDDLKRVTESLQKDFYNTKEDVKSQVNQIGDQLQQIDLSKQLDLAHDDAESIKTIDNKPSSAPIGKDDHVR